MSDEKESDASESGGLRRTVIQLRAKPEDKAIWEHCCPQGKLSEWFRSLGRAHIATAVRATRGCYVRLKGRSAVDYWSIYAEATDMAIYDRRGDRVEDPTEGDHDIDDLHAYADIEGGIGDEVWGIVEVESDWRQGEEEGQPDYVHYYELEMRMWAANSAEEAAYTYGLATGSKQYRVYSLRTMAGGDEKLPAVEVGID